MVERVYGRLEPAMLAVLIAESIGTTSAQFQQTGADSVTPSGLGGLGTAANPLKLAPHAQRIENAILSALRESRTYLGLFVDAFGTQIRSRTLCV